MISDVHGNLPALDAVLAAVDAAGADALLCAGDIVGYGAFPNECIERLAGLAAHCVAGNHDLVALGLQPEDLLDPLGVETMRWTHGILGAEARGYLADLPLQLEVEPGVVVAHGSLHNPWRYVGARAAETELGWLTRDRPDGRLLLLGHTHAPLAYCEGLGALVTDQAVTLVPDHRYLLNPGAVGQSREELPLARCLILDTEAGVGLFLTVDYDAERYADDLRRVGLPPDAHHRPPRPANEKGSRLRRALERRTGR